MAITLKSLPYKRVIKKSFLGYVAIEESRKDFFKTITRKPTGKRVLERPRSRWEDEIRMYFKEIGINTRNWVDTAQDRHYWRALVIVALNFLVRKAMEFVVNKILD